MGIPNKSILIRLVLSGIFIFQTLYLSNNFLGLSVMSKESQKVIVLDAPMLMVTKVEQISLLPRGTILNVENDDHSFKGLSMQVFTSGEGFFDGETQTDKKEQIELRPIQSSEIKNLLKFIHLGDEDIAYIIHFDTTINENTKIKLLEQYKVEHIKKTIYEI